MAFDHVITTLDQLDGQYGGSSDRVRAKIIDHVDPGARAFIAASPLLVLATASASGCDASPRGGPPGFVRVLDERRLAMADLSGNRLLDSFRNIVEQPQVGMIFLIPGMDETLRVNGRACLTTDPAVLEACRIDDQLPRVALGLDVEQCYIHCAKAFRRGQVWDPESWPAQGDRPSAAEVLKGHLCLDVEPQLIEDDLERGYSQTMWVPGG